MIGADDDSIGRQTAKDRAYLAACRQHGIEPDAPRYVTALQATSDEAIDAALNEGRGAKNGHSYRTYAADPEPLRELPPEAEAAWKVLELIIPHKSDPAAFAATAGRRAIVLAWLLGRRREPLIELARHLKVSRASLSTYARTINDRLGLTGRGQKAASTRATYADNARRSWKLRRLNAALAEAVKTS